MSKSCKVIPTESSTSMTPLTIVPLVTEVIKEAGFTKSALLMVG